MSPAFDGNMLWAAAALCFFGFLHSGEITIPSDSSFDEGAHLSFHDVTVDCLSHPRVHLKASKTDPFRVGIDNFIGKTDNRWREGQILVRSFAFKMANH